jgi:hypothetical protein
VKTSLPKVVEADDLVLQSPGEAGRLRPLVGVAAAAPYQLGNQVGHGEVEVGEVRLVLLQALQVILTKQKINRFSALEFCTTKAKG